MPRVSKRFRGKLCIYCLRDPSTSTGDHVFAREFFPESERADLPKVPACEACNNKKSKLMGWMAPSRHLSARMVVVEDHQEQEPSMSEITTIGIDIAKHVFQLHGVDEAGKVVLCRRL